jgi:phage shock protein PspC (stress-responsive transcriptional regulator)
MSPLFSGWPPSSSSVPNSTGFLCTVLPTITEAAQQSRGRLYSGGAFVELLNPAAGVLAGAHTYHESDRTHVRILAVGVALLGAYLLAKRLMK